MQPHHEPIQPSHWVSLHGKTIASTDALRFVGGATPSDGDAPQHAFDVVLSDTHFGGGTIATNIAFDDPSTTDRCGVILFFQPSTQSFIVAQLGGDYLCSLWTFASGRWLPHGSVGLRDMLVSNRRYHLAVKAHGSEVRFTLDGIDVLTATLPIPLPHGQTGVWFRGLNPILVEGFRVTTSRPRAFVVMQFTDPYSALYQEVITPVCESLSLKAERADDKFGPGVIIRDIEDHIRGAQVVIADVTPRNPNVYYEVGYAHALNKPTILIAASPTELPFDVSAFRVLFYQDTIAGKARFEAGLREHLQAILGGGLSA